MYLQRKGNKFGAKKTVFNGRRYDSKFEASVAQELELRLKAGEITGIEPQYKVEMWLYRENGLRGFKVSHKVDFRVRLPDGAYELIEAKGMVTSDYRWRRMCLENIWLPDHPDHTYIVVKQ